MIECPNCKNKEFPGALFCAQCGAQLTKGNDATQSLSRETGNILFDSAIVRNIKDLSPAVALEEATVTLHILDTGQFLPLLGQEIFTLGRLSQGQAQGPDIDLTDYNAYMQGVSRVHASVSIDKNRVFLTDLGSVNGTRVNGVRLEPHAARPLQNGDIIILGKLKIQAIIRY
jgi:pSer/pThr/pTyr-binding forkhead associated (FHA) protein